jgi:hypothetical protein
MPQRPQVHRPNVAKGPDQRGTRQQRGYTDGWRVGEIATARRPEPFWHLHANFREIGAWGMARKALENRHSAPALMRTKAKVKKPLRTPDAADPPLRLEWRSPSELAENPANWRRHPAAQVQALTDILAEVGWAGACLFNERTGRLIDGHARRKVALEQGAPAVPVLVGSWDEAAERKILATLDPIAVMAESDKAALDALLRDMHTGSETVAGVRRAGALTGGRVG